MKQLKQENRMHGRVRMIVASFLTKDLLLDRRLGEAHFARYLLDYDTNVNIGNWQWSASVGADPKPLRIFNPILQSQRFDPQAEYILNYIPELKGQDIKAIHDPLSYDLNYCKPIVNHYENSKLAKQMYYESYSINNKS
jgi:deoxyribodipyrimidine photo-lyase